MMKYLTKTKYLLSIVATLLLLTSSSYGQEWQTNFDESKTLAAAENKTILLVFSGSDWCAPCIKLEKEIWHSEIFQAYAKDHFILQKADFPRKKANKLDAEQVNHNKELAEKYNSKGYFPLVAILDKDENLLGETGYKKMSPEEYIQHINSFITK